MEKVFPKTLLFFPSHIVATQILVSVLVFVSLVYFKHTAQKDLPSNQEICASFKIQPLHGLFFHSDSWLDDA